MSLNIYISQSKKFNLFKLYKMFNFVVDLESNKETVRNKFVSKKKFFNDIRLMFCSFL